MIVYSRKGMCVKDNYKLQLVRSKPLLLGSNGFRAKTKKEISEWDPCSWAWSFWGNKKVGRKQLSFLLSQFNWHCEPIKDCKEYQLVKKIRVWKFGVEKMHSILVCELFYQVALDIGS